MSDVFSAERQAQTVGIEVNKLLDQMRAQARVLPANVSGSFNRLTDQIEMLVRTYLQPSPPELLNGIHLTKMEGRIVARLAVAMGRTVTKDLLLNAMYFDCRGEEPDGKILDILIFRIRQKLKAANSPLFIENIWGQGFTLKEIDHAAAA